MKVTESPRGDTVEGQGATRPVQIHSNPVGARRGCWYFYRLVVMLSAVVILRAEQTPGLICVSKPTEVRASPPTDPPHHHSNVHPASSPLHLPVVASGEAFATQHLGDTLKPAGVIWVLLCLPDPRHLLSTIVQKERLGNCVCVQSQRTCICTKYRYGYFSFFFINKLY